MKITTYTKFIINSLLEINNAEFDLKQYIDLVTKMDECYPTELERSNYSLLELTNVYNNISSIQAQIDLLNNKSFIWLYSTITESILSENMKSCKCALHILLGSNKAQEKIEQVLSFCKDEQWYQDAYYQLLTMGSKSEAALNPINLKAV
ncbi:hypothetical protein P4679_25645 [Priestia megaterium]|uniref:hypothetical protein n=1 Tax=Priestia megaterium TaxID=1404 RepID=UPI002E1CFA22|nr:hypothetical protein [Priestia megaterium]